MLSYITFRLHRFTAQILPIRCSTVLPLKFYRFVSQLDQYLACFQTVDRQKGLVSSSAKKNRCETRDQQLKYELRTSIKAAIYRIVLAFGPHIQEIPLPPEHEKRIQTFVNFMEG